MPRGLSPVTRDRYQRLAVGGWEHIKPPRSARSADPTQGKYALYTRYSKLHTLTSGPVSGSPVSAYSLQWVGLSALAQPRLTKGGQPYLET